MGTRVIGYTKDGYYRVLAELDERQIWRTCGAMMDVESDSIARDFRSGVGFNPRDFPEVVKFDVIVEQDPL